MKPPKNDLNDDRLADGFTRYVVPELEVLGRVSRSITPDLADAEDLVQETLLRAYRAMAGFDGRYPRAWLLVIMRNTQKNRVRRKRHPLMRDPDRALAQVANSAADAANPETIVHAELLDVPVERSLNALPVQFRNAVQCVDLDGLSYAETAAWLEIPVGTVMSRVHRGRRLMRDRLCADPDFTHRPR